MSATNILTSEETLSLGQRASQAQSALEAHVEQNHGQTHLDLLITTPANPYVDSAGQSWPSSNARVAVIQISGVKYYVPAQIVT
jgi:hypothetical protein